MSVLDSMSESLHEAMYGIYDEEQALRNSYEHLSKIWELYPNAEMVYTLDRLLDNIDDLKQWRELLEKIYNNLDSGG